MALPPNAVNMNTVYMDHLVGVGQAGPPTTAWYDYNTFNNLLVAPSMPPPQISIPQHHIHTQVEGGEIPQTRGFVGATSIERGSIE